MPGTSRFAAGEGAFVVSFACMNAKVASKVAAGCESTVASAADMFFLWDGLLRGLIEGGRGGGRGGGGLA